MKKLIPMLLAVALLLSFAACGGKDGDPTTTAAPDATDVTTEAVTTSAATEPAAETTTAEPTTAPTTEPTTEPTTVTTTAVPTTAAPTTAAPTTKAPTTKAPTTKPAPTTKKPTTTKKQVVAPTAKKDIVALYNAATATAASAKPGYTKKTNTTLSELNFGALGRMEIVRTAVGDFLGEGQSTQTVAKGKFDGKALKKSSLTADDVTSATCTLSKDGKYYDVTLNLKGEANPAKGKSALGRATEDFKDVAELKAGMQEAGASVGTVSTQTSNVVLKARISVEGNRFASLSLSYRMTADLTNIRYTIVSVSKGNGTLNTTVTYSDFKY